MNEVILSDIRIEEGSRFRKEIGDLSDLKASIARLGLLQAIGITSDNVLVFGERRVKACIELGWTSIPAKVVDFDALMSIEAEFDENECRKQFTVTEREAIAEEIERRQGERRGRPWDEKKEDDGGEIEEDLIMGNSPELKKDDSPSKGQVSRDYAAKRAGFSSTDQYRSAKKVVHRGIPELQDAMDAGRVSISAAATIAELPPEEQVEVVALPPKEIIKKSNDLREQKRRERLAKHQAEFQATVAKDIIIGDVAYDGTTIVHCMDCREALRSVVDPESVDLIITAPPSLADLNKDNDYPLSQKEYLDFLFDVWLACRRVIKPGGRIAVNIAHGVGRNPWWPVGALVTAQISEVFDLRTTITWDKGIVDNKRDWGTFQNPFSPHIVTRSELLIVGNTPGDIAIPENRLSIKNGAQVSPWINSTQFMELSEDVWTMPSENKLPYPAFHPDLPKRLIQLYGWPGCMVCDPFAGIGTTGIAAIELGADCILIDSDEKQCKTATKRCAETRRIDI